jgi:carboxyl-terminal processing protease
MESPMIDHPDRLAMSVVPVEGIPPEAATAGVTTTRRFQGLHAALAGVALLAGCALFLSGYSLGRQSAVEPGTPTDDPAAFRPFWDTYHTINDRYAGGTVDRERMIQGAIRGMIDSLADPYSAYLTSDQYRASLQGISGEFEGIGADLASQPTDGSATCATIGPTCRLVIVRPIDGSPAERAGLLPGDRVLAADGVPLDGLSVDAALAKIRGPKGTILELSILRGGTSPFELTITRDIVQEPDVETRVLAGGIVGYVRLMGFSDRSAGDFAAAVRDQVAAGRRRLVIDLRGDPGGYVTAAREVASQFIGSGTIFWEQDARGRQTATLAMSGGAATDPAIQVVCLIDHGSASASEIVAAALQDAGRATLVGQRSFGKGTVQQWQELAGEGGAFRLTIARWLSPDKRWIHGVGLEPDVTVAVPPDLGAGADPVLDRALEILVPAAAPIAP